MGDNSVDAFLAAYPLAIRELAHALRALVVESVPDAIERVRGGWRLIGYDVPLGRRTRYFAYIAPEIEHIHLGFEHGALMSDPRGLLHGAHLGLRQVRYLTFMPGDRVPRQATRELIRRAAAIAAMSRGERSALALVNDLR